jgi:hypothetical protein
MDRTVSSPQAPATFAPKPQKAFAIAFAVLALGLAGCASGLGATAEDASALKLARVEDATLLASRPAALDASAVDRLKVAYTVKLSTGELATISQPNDGLIADGAAVLVEYGDQVRIIPQGRPAD